MPDKHEGHNGMGGGVIFDEDLKGGRLLNCDEIFCEQCLVLAFYAWKKGYWQNKVILIIVKNGFQLKKKLLGYKHLTNMLNVEVLTFDQKFEAWDINFWQTFSISKLSTIKFRRLLSAVHVVGYIETWDNKTKLVIVNKL